MIDENIICFSKDWNEDPTSNHHVLKLLARQNRVLWINSVSTRTPNLSNGRDLKKIARKLKSFASGIQQVEENLWVFTPVVLPFPHSPAATTVNRWILKFSLNALRWKLGMKEFQLWSFLPNVGDYVGTMGESVVVYYCTDEWSRFTGMNAEGMAEAEQKLLGKTDIAFGTARSLVENRRDQCQEIRLATHGVEYEKFAKALKEDTPLPADLAALPQPVLGFYGLIEDWVDFDLIAYLAQRHPEWSLTLLGKSCVDTEKIEKYPNVHLLGRKHHSELPNYCKGFSVGIIPYLLTERLLHVNPIKLREYLSAGLPVVSTPLPEVKPYEGLCAVADTPEAFERAVLTALQTDSPETRRRRSEAMKEETWEKKVETVSADVMRAKIRKQQTKKEEN